MTMRLGVVAEFTDRASKRMAKMLRFNQKMEKINKAQARLGAAQASNQDKVTRATERTSRIMTTLRRTMAGVASAGQGLSRGVVTFMGHIGRAIARVNTLRKSLDLAGRSRGLVNRGAGLAAGGAGKIARGAAVAGGIAAGVTATAGAAAGAVIGPAAQMERYQTILETTTGSADKAKAAMGWVTDFAVKTPYELADVMEGFVQLQSYGLDPMDGLLESLGNTSAAMGKPMMQAVEAMADAVTGENERLKEFGIKARKAGDYFYYEYTQNGVTKVAKALASDRAAIQKTLTGIFDVKYGGAMDRLSRTWEGMVSNISDMWFKFRLMVADSGVFDWAKEKLRGFLDMLNRMEADGSLKALAEEIGDNIIITLKAIWEFGKGLWSTMKTLGGWLSFAADALGGWNNLAMVFVALPFASTLLGMVSGLALVASGLFTVATGALGLVASGALGALRLFLTVNIGVYRLLFAGALKAVSGVMALGRAVIMLGVASARGAVAGLVGLWRGMLRLPGAAMRAGAGLRALALATIGLPGKLLAVSRALAATALSGLKSLPGLLMGAARGFVMMSAAGLAKLPGLLLTAGRAFMVFGAGLMATPVGWFLAGIAAIAGAAYLIYEYWEPISAFFASLWAGIKEAGNSAIEFFSSLNLTSFIPEITWGDVLTVLDWASWILPVRWLDLLPGFSWEKIITSVLNWASFIPLPDFGEYFNFEWADILPEWDWGSIIPEMPEWINPSSWFSDDPATPTVTVPEIASADPASLERAHRASEKLTAAMSALQETAKAVPGVVQSALDAANTALAAVDFTYHGQRMMETIAAGMRARAHRLVEEIRSVTQAVRDHLPSSPAKVGPLSDIHRLKFSETMAQSIRPAPLVRAMKRAAAATLAAATLAGPVVANPSLAAAAPKELRPSSALVDRASGASASGSASKTGSGITIHFAPVITIGAGGENLKEQVMDALEEFLPELASKLQAVQGENERLEF